MHTLIIMYAGNNCTVIKLAQKEGFLNGLILFLVRYLDKYLD